MSNPDLQAELDHIEDRIRNVRLAYDKYFLGIERRSPEDLRNDAQRSLREFERRVSNNTAVRFRFQALKARWITLTTYWNRTLKQIEEGKYKPHLVKAELHERERELARRQKEEAGAAGRQGAGASASTTAGRTNGQSAGNAPASPLDRLHEQYADARSQTGERGVSKDKLAQVVRKQAQAIKQRYKCKSVEFKVVIEDGKTKLKAIPRN